MGVPSVTEKKEKNTYSWEEAKERLSGLKSWIFGIMVIFTLQAKN